MILICDRCVTERAALIREEIFALGYPCAVAPIWNIADHRPIKIIISFADICEEIVGLITEDVQTIIIGGDFVNSVHNVKHACDVPAALREIRSYAYGLYGISDAKRSAFGFSLTPSLFLANDFFTVNGHVIEPTKSEYMIFKYLTAFAGEEEYFPPEKIAQFCFPLTRAEKSAPSVVVHVANLNKKIGAVYGERVVLSKRCRGYYVLKI